MGYLGVKLLLVAEDDRFERENRFASFVHRLDLVLETRRGNDRAELTVIPTITPTPPGTVAPLIPAMNVLF